MTGKVGGRRAFDRFRAEGQRFHHGVVWCIWVPDDLAVPPRVAFAVGRAVGGAVVRNTIRRRLRAVLHEELRAARVPAGQYLVGVRPEAASTPYTRIAADLRAALAGARRG